MGFGMFFCAHRNQVDRTCGKHTLLAGVKDVWLGVPVSAEGYRVGAALVKAQTEQRRAIAQDDQELKDLDGSEEKAVKGIRPVATTTCQCRGLRIQDCECRGRHARSNCEPYGSSVEASQEVAGKGNRRRQPSEYSSAGERGEP